MWTRRRAAITALLFASTPAVSHAEWILDKISDDRVAAIVTGRVGDSTDERLYILGRGSAGDATRKYVQVDESKPGFATGIHAWTATTKNASPGSHLTELRKATAGWVRTNISWNATHGAELLIGSFCDRPPALYAQFWDSTVLEARQTGGLWSVSILRGSRPRDSGCPMGYTWNAEWPRNMSKLTNGNGFTTSLAGLGTYRFQCDKGHWREDGIILNPGNRSILLLQEGEARGQGIPRHYALAMPNTMLFETAEAFGDTWRGEQIAGENVWTLSHVTIGAARDDGKSRLYVSGFRELWEYSLEEGKFKGEPLAAPRTDPRIIGNPAGLFIASLRGDGKARLYLANGANLLEYSFTRGRWTSETISPGIGELARATFGSVSGLREPHIFLAGEIEGLYSLRWTPKKRMIVVAPFGNRSGSEGDIAAFADLLRLEVAKRGDCGVLEREKISAVIDEQKLRISGAVDPKSAVAMGRILGADSVVAGAIGQLGATRVATINVLSVATGAVERSLRKQWAADKDGAEALAFFAEKICPTAKVNR